MKNLRALLSLSLLLPLAACSASEEDSAAPSAVTTTVVHSADAPAGDDAADGTVGAGGTGGADAADTATADDVASGAAPGASGTAPAPASSTIPPLPEGACATSQLSTEITNEQGAAGSRLVDIVLTNTSDEECTLTGFPGVSAVTSNDGTQLGPAALRETGTEAATVTLAPGAQARAGSRSPTWDCSTRRPANRRTPMACGSIRPKTPTASMSQCRACRPARARSTSCLSSPSLSSPRKSFRSPNNFQPVIGLGFALR
ncbi:DUF4232 domain-containing protein [Corynebacterium guaraldiae]|uniref:DUF4232 domain-containing protein n=1 Tax=Corynebacterium guaraldiae TaxID=3051103 RepID=UPI001E52DFCD|nr:DUF4232 domain-containing protein [Corynebacterium guaraldiae]